MKGGTALFVNQPVGVVGQLRDIVRCNSGIVRRGLDLANRVAELRRMSAQLLRGHVDILENVGDRILVLVAEQLGQALGQPLNPIDQLRRAIEQSADSAGCRRNDRAALRPGLLDRRSAAFGALQLDFADSGEADAVNLRAGALEHRRLVIDIDPDPDELGPVREQGDLLDLADRDAGKADVRALVEPADALREVDIVAFGRLVGEAGEPDNEQQGAGEQSHRHRADHHIVRPRLH